MAAKLVHEEGTNTANSGRPPSPGHLSNSELVLGHNEPQHHYSDPGPLTQIIYSMLMLKTHYHRATIFAQAQAQDIQNTQTFCPDCLQ